MNGKKRLTGDLKGEDVILYENGLEEFPRSSMLMANVSLIMIIVLGAYVFLFYGPLPALLYLVLSLFGSYIFLRKVVCTDCYYYGKRCCMGWGLLSAVLFKKGKVEDFNRGPGILMAPLVYGLIMALPMVVLAHLMVRGHPDTVLNLVILITILVLSIYSLGPGRAKGCRRCKMRYHCMGSAYKKQVK